MNEIKESALVIWSTPVYMVLILAEILISNAAHKPVYSLQNTLENIFLCLLNSAIDLLMRSVALFTLLWTFQFHQFDPVVNGAFYWVVLVILIDFQFYLLHYVDHKCRFFWAIHVTHHSSEEFNLTVGFRSSVFQPIYRFIYFMPIALLGFQPVDILFVYSASQIYGILLHTKLVGKLGWLEWILATPSHHRVHHGSNPEYLDKNMGMVLIVWDRLFGTFQEETVTVKYGITKPTNHNPIKVLFHDWISIASEMKAADSLKEKVKILFGAPR